MPCSILHDRQKPINHFKTAATKGRTLYGYFAFNDPRKSLTKDLFHFETARQMSEIFGNSEGVQFLKSSIFTPLTFYFKIRKLN